MKTFKRRMYTEQERQVILNFYRQGIKIAMLSKNFGIPDSTIATWVAIDRGYAPKRALKAVKNEDIEDIDNTDDIDEDIDDFGDDAEKEEILEGKRHIMEQIKKKGEIKKANDFVEEKTEELFDALDDSSAMNDALFAGYKEGYRDGLKEVFKYLNMIK